MREIKDMIDVRDEIQSLQRELLGIYTIMDLCGWAISNGVDIDSEGFSFFAFSCKVLVDKLQGIDEFLKDNPSLK